MRKGVGVLLAALVFLAGCGGPAFKGQARGGAAPDFTLTDQSGQPFRLSDQKDKVVLLYFGYTYCPDVCPTSLSDFKRVDQILGADADRVRVVFVTVDPERDSPPRLKQYLAIFGPQSAFVGLSGTTEQMAPVYKAYNITHEKVPSKADPRDYFVNHSAATFLIDRAGQWRVTENYGTSPEDFATDIRLVLNG
jgi:protein SCO1